MRSEARAARPLFVGQLLRVVQDDLRLSLVELDLAGDADLLSLHGLFGGSELRAVAPEDERRENRIGIGLAEVQEGRAAPGLSGIFGGDHQAANGNGLADMLGGLLGGERGGART